MRNKDLYIELQIRMGSMGLLVQLASHLHLVVDMDLVVLFIIMKSYYLVDTEEIVQEMKVKNIVYFYLW